MDGSKAKRACLGVLIALSFVLAAEARAADISFTANTELSLTGLATTLYALSGSEADTLTVDGSTLTVDIPANSSFTLGAGSTIHNVLRITPTGGTVTLTFEAANLTAGGYATQWTLGSSTATSWAILVGVSQPSTSHSIKVNSNHHGFFEATSSGEVTFSYGGNLSNRTFSITQEGAGGTVQLIPEAREQFLEKQQGQGIEALRLRVRELQLQLIQLLGQFVGLLQKELVARGA